MTQRLYIVDMVQIGNYRSPAHFGGRVVEQDAALAGVVARYFDYGLINQVLVIADVNQAQSDYLDLLSDVFVWPENLEATVPANQVNGLKNELEAREVPVDWVNAGDTYRIILREICWYFTFMQKLTAKTGINPMTLNIRLSVRYSDIPTVWQDAISETLTEMGLSPAFIGSNTSLRQIMRQLGIFSTNTAWHWAGAEMDI